MTKKEKAKLVILIEFIISGSFFIISLGYLENKHLIQSAVFLVLAIIFYYLAKNKQKALGSKNKNKK